MGTGGDANAEDTEAAVRRGITGTDVLDLLKPIRTSSYCRERSIEGSCETKRMRAQACEVIAYECRKEAYKYLLSRLPSIIGKFAAF